MSSKTRRPPVHPGQIVTVEPEKLVAGGESLSRIEGFPVFARDLYPGDLARVRVLEVKKGFARAEMVELARPSPLRRLSPCPVSRQCGGCDWTELRLDAQLRAKREILLESLTRIGRIDRDAIPPIRIHDSPLNYRLRSRLHVSGDGRLGFFAPSSHVVVPLPESCEVVGPETLRAAPRLRSDSSIDAVLFFEDADRLHAVGLPLRENAGEATLDVGGRTWTTSVDAFFQVNRHLLETMQSLVFSLSASTQRVDLAYDLYGGAGFFAWPLSKHFRRVITVESSPSGHVSARRNMRDVPHVHAREVAVETFIESAEPADLIFLDPPRAGAAPGVIDSVATLARESVCYLSCDPVTFSRDVSRLLRRGWILHEIHLLDLFPNTHHVETLAAFRRA